jgi:SAM-dependent methyltransferase
VTETDRIRRIYDDRAAARDYADGLTERLLLGSLRREFGARLRGETLEIGVGSGLNLPYYSPAVTRAVGLDLSAAMLARARQRAADVPIPVELIQGDAEALPFPDEAFDTVAASLALCTVPNPINALSEMARVCRPDGQIVMLEHVLSPLAPVAVALRLLSPLQERALGCHLDRATFDVARGLGFAIVEERRRLFGVFRLVVARPAANSPSPIAMGEGVRG